MNQTSDRDIYAVGDAVEKEDWVGGGRLADRPGQRRQPPGPTGGRPHLRPAHRAPWPSLGTAIVKVFDLTAATTGWNEKRLLAAGRQYRAIHSHPMSHAGYYPGAQPHGAQAPLRPRRRDHPRSPGVGRERRRQAHRRHRHRHGRRASPPMSSPTSSSPTRLRSRRPRTRSTCSATWPRTSDRRLRRRGPRRARG